MPRVNLEHSPEGDELDAGFLAGVDDVGTLRQLGNASLAGHSDLYSESQVIR